MSQRLPVGEMRAWGISKQYVKKPCLRHVGTSLLDNGMEPGQHKQQLGLQGGSPGYESWAPRLKGALQITLHAWRRLKAHLHPHTNSSETSVEQSACLLSDALDGNMPNCTCNE